MQNKRSLLTPLPGLAVLLLLVFFTLVSKTLTVSNDGQYLFIACISLLAVGLPTAFFCKVRGIGNMSGLCIRPLDLSGVLLAIICAVLMMCGSTCAKLLVMHFGIGSSDVALYGFFLPTSSSDIASGLYSVVVFALVPALIEEFLFRCVLFREYEKSGSAAAVVMTALLYALTAMSVSNFPVLFVYGIVSGILVYVTRSVFAAMIAHFLTAIYALFLERSIFDFAAKPDNQTFLFFILGTVFLLFLVLALGEAERLFYRRAVNNEPTATPAGGRRGVCRELISPLFLVACGVYVIFILLLR